MPGLRHAKSLPLFNSAFAAAVQYPQTVIRINRRSSTGVRHRLRSARMNVPGLDEPNATPGLAGRVREKAGEPEATGCVVTVTFPHDRTGERRRPGFLTVHLL